MKRRANPGTLTMLLLLGGAGVGGYLWWRSRRAAAPPAPQVHERPAAEAPPLPEETVAGGCYVADRPAPERGYTWECRNGLWKKRRTDSRRRDRAPRLVQTTLLPTGGW